MKRIRNLGRNIAVSILGISSILSFASGKALKLQQESTGNQGSADAIAGQSKTLLPSSSRLVAGGDQTGTVARTAFLEDPRSSARQEAVNDLLHARAFHSATLLPNGRVLIFGGAGSDSSVVSQAELFDPQTRSFKGIATGGLTPRAHHSATLLTDGRMLLAGGIDSQGHTLNRIELWDFRSGQVSTLGVTLNTPRSGQIASLLPDGTVLLWGGLDANGNPLNDGEILDPNGPSVRLVGRRVGDLQQPSSPYLAASIPQSGETSVATDQLLSLRFSEPLTMTSLDSATVSLKSSAGNVPINVIPAEGGMLAFITPKESLDTDTTYTLIISGGKDVAGQLMPDTTVLFTTAQVAEEGSTASGGSSAEGGTIAPGAEGINSAGSNELPSDPRHSPMLKAPNGVSGLAGQVLTLDRSPLPNVRVEIDSQFAMTDNTGRFVVQNIGSGHHVMIIDGTTANTKSASYGLYRVGVDLKAGRTNSLNYTVWMTALDTVHEVSIPSPTTSETIITNPDVPGLEVHIPAGTLIRDARGSVVTHIGITGIPVSQPPFPIPSGVQYPIYFTVQPGGATFEAQNEVWSPSAPTRRRGVTIHYHNYLNAKPGSRFPFWRYDPEQKGWYVYGHGRVSADARDVAPEEGTQMSSFDGAMTSSESNGDAKASKPCLLPIPFICNPGEGEPVDLQTGLFVYRKTDMTLNDVIPLSLSRAYRPGDSNLRAFGIGTSMPFDDFMTGDNNSTPEGYTYQDLNLEDGAKVHFTRTSPCLGPNGYCDFTNALYEATSAPGEFYGAILQFAPSGGFDLGITTADYWQLTKKDGTVYLFPDSDGATNPRAAAIQAMHDRFGNALTFTRDSNFNLTQIVSPNGRWIQFAYDAGNRVTQALDNSGRTVSYAYTTAGYLETVTDANGGLTKYNYDDNGNMVSIQDPRGIIYVQNQYNAEGMVSIQTQADGSTYQFSYVLDANGNVTQTTVTDPRGYVRQVNFNSDGWMTSDTRAVGRPEQQTINYNRQAGTGLVLGVTDALNRTTTYSYDAMADVSSMTLLSGTASATTTTFAYDEHFYEPSSVTDPLGNMSSMTYDSSGNLIAATDPLGDTTALTYNTAGQPTTVTDPLGNETQFGYDSGNLVSITDPLGRTSTRFADDAGRVVSVSDPLNDTTSVVYDPLDEVTSTTDPMGDQTLFTYDGNGNRLTVTDANQHKTAFMYDNMDHMVKRTDPLGNNDSFQYDSNGNLTQTSDRKGQITTIQYDGLNRPTVDQYNDGSTVTNTFDAGNRLTTIADSLSGTISRSYDLLNDLLSETTPQGSVSYTYDTDRRRQTMTVSGQSQISYTSDNASRLTSISQSGSNVSFTYDAKNRRTSLTLPNGVTAQYIYDAASQLTGIVYQGGALAPENLEYTYDLAARRTSMSGSLATTQLPTAVSSAVYNANNQLTEWGATAMTYDANGNTLSDGMNSYVWDARNRLVSANSNGATFAYDPLGRRANKNILTASTSFLYDGMNPVQELNSSTVTANLLTGGVDERFARTDSTGTSDYLTDALGSTVALTDLSGNSTVQYSYSPFGAVSITGTTNNSFTYTGREADGLGINYYRARYYNPNIGRFLSEDPMGFKGSGPNLYAYAGNNPISFRDPFGLDRGGANGGEAKDGWHNPYATAATDAAGLVAAAADSAKLGVVSAIVSMANDYSPQNIITNLLGFVPGYGWPMAIGGAYNDFFSYGVNNSDPGPHTVYDSGTQPQLPTQDGGCQAEGLPEC